MLHDQTRAPLPPKAGAVERCDYEYVREGTADLFVMVEPLAGWRHVAVTKQRTRCDFAECLRYLVEERYPTAEYVRLVVDNLNTHVPAALYETFPPQQARAILERLVFRWSSITRPSMGAGSLWPRSRSASSSAAVSRALSAICQP